MINPSSIKSRIGRCSYDILQKVLFGLHYRRLKRMLSISRYPKCYQKYLSGQLKRTLQSYKVPLPKRARFLIDKTADLFDLSQFNILCVGVRNSAEMDYFKAKGAKNVIGIDLFSIHPDILIMDMHTMTFQNSLFDMVYSSHSLEHAYDLKKVTNEFLRVLRNRGILVIEVPVNFDRKKTGTDLIDFHTWDELHSNFMPCEVIWCDSYEANEYPGETGVDAIRSIMQVHKDTHAK